MQKTSIPGRFSGIPDQPEDGIGKTAEPNLEHRGDRLSLTLHDHDVMGERSIAIAQACISLFVLTLHVGAQARTGWQPVNFWVAITLGGLIATSLLRYIATRRGTLPETLLSILNLTDISIFLGLIWSYQFAYGHPAGGVLKAPTLVLLFVLVALRALRFHPRAVIVSGFTAVAGWCSLVLLAILADQPSGIIHDYSQFMTSYGILLGAEAEKIVALAMLTLCLTAATYKARQILSEAAHAADYAAALNASKLNLVAAQDARRSAESALSQLDKRDAELVDQATLFKTALDNMSQGVCMYDAEKVLLVCNDRYIDIYGMSPELAKPGTPFREVLEDRIRRGIYAGDTPGDYIQERLEGVEEDKETTKVQELTDGRTIAINHRPMPGGGWVGTHEDITERKRIEAQMRHMELHDALTGLPNRTVLRQRIEGALRHARRGQGFAVLFLDLSRFNNINDTLGHSLGDELLKLVSHRLMACIRETDMLARLSGDQFAIVQGNAKQPDEATQLAERIRSTIRVPFDLSGHQVIIDTRIGITIAAHDSDDPDQLLRNAAMALNVEKQKSRGCCSFFEAGMNQRMQQRRQLELDMRSGLMNGQFELYYQPLFNLESRDFSAFEALLRWNHPERGLIPPAEFIPLAEEIGFVTPLGKWVIEQACADAADWPHRVKVAVNLSPVQFDSGELVMTVITALAKAQFSASRLQLEITESILLWDEETTLDILHQLRDMGVQIVMDDFGTGYSSLSYLQSFPFDKIKIDQSFIKDLSADGDTDSAIILHAIASLGNSLGIETTAEGVETEEQLKIVRAAGCTEMQGFLCSPPRPASDIQEWFHNREVSPVRQALGA